ncbi:MAG: cohesin domain-containing protein [Candidatus Hydrogenedentota bacterium]
MSIRMTRFAILCTATVFLGSLAAAGTLRVGSPSFQGSDVTVPILLEGSADQGVSALDFRLNYDPEVFQPVSASTGAAASDANKQVQANSTRDGEYSVVMLGMNQSTIADGEVASVRFERVSEPASGRSNVRVSRTTLASADGAEIPSEGGTATIELNGEEANEDAPADAEEAETAENTTPQPGQEQDDSASQTPAAGTQEEQSAAQDEAQRSTPPVRGRAQPPDEEPGQREDEDGPEGSAEQLARTLDDADDARTGISEFAEPPEEENGNSEPGPRRQSHDLMEDANENEMERTTPRAVEDGGETASGPNQRGALTEREQLAQADPSENSPGGTEADSGIPAATTGSQAEGSGAAPYVIGGGVVLGLAALFVMRNKLLA